MFRAVLPPERELRRRLRRESHNTRLYGFETVTTRYFNVFGPRQDPGSPYSGVISLFAAALLEGRTAVIYGDGEQTRDFTFVANVANVVDGVLRACEAPDAVGEVMNVACGGRISLNELLRVMNRLVGTNSRPIFKPERAGDVRDSQADIAKAGALLGYRPLVGLEEGLRRTLEWCHEQAPGAIARLPRGDNSGKLLVHLVETEI